MAARTWCNKEMKIGDSGTVEGLHHRGDEPAGVGGALGRGEQAEGRPVISAPKFVGRGLTTHVEMAEEPVWGPLEAVARLARARPDLPSFHEDEFMFMGTVRDARQQRAIHLYKHVDTRRYLNLDEDGNAYAYLGRAPDDAGPWSGGRHGRYRALVDAIAHLDLELFEGDRPLFRSFPPEAWPPDGPTGPAPEATEGQPVARL